MFGWRAFLLAAAVFFLAMQLIRIKFALIKVIYSCGRPIGKRSGFSENRYIAIYRAANRNRFGATNRKRAPQKKTIYIEATHSI